MLGWGDNGTHIWRYTGIGALLGLRFKVAVLSSVHRYGHFRQRCRKSNIWCELVGHREHDGREFNCPSAWIPDWGRGVRDVSPISHRVSVISWLRHLTAGSIQCFSKLKRRGLPSTYHVRRGSVGCI
jgi:hypothetical protein